MRTATQFSAGVVSGIVLLLLAWEFSSVLLGAVGGSILTTAITDGLRSLNASLRPQTRHERRVSREATAAFRERQLAQRNAPRPPLEPGSHASDDAFVSWPRA